MTNWIKICGIRSVEDAAMIASAGATAIGLNFYSLSKRYVSPESAKSICDAVRTELDVVGVFVNSPVEETVSITRDVGLNAVQFHGDETSDVIARFHQTCPETSIIRAYRIGADGIATMADSIQELVTLGIPLSAILVDALVDGEYGGTGHRVDPDLLRDCPANWPPLVLAGGLNPETVARAVTAVRPWGVDTASGVEISPGIKCPVKVEKFVDAIRSTTGDKWCSSRLR